jgi:hypothetical protein
MGSLILLGTKVSGTQLCKGADIDFCLFIKINVLSEKALFVYTKGSCVSEV